MGQCYVESYNGERKEVKNLGWLIKNASKVTSLHICRSGSIATGEPNGCTAGILWAYLDTSQAKIDGNPPLKYVSYFASWKIMQKWISRRCFDHASVCNWSESTMSVAPDMRKLMNSIPL